MSEPTNPCTCAKCVACCHRRPGFPTLEEARRLIELGFGDKLMLDYWVSESTDEYDGKDVYLLCPATVGNEGRSASFWPCGTCALLVNNLCSVHDTGAKPLECAMAHGCDKAIPRTASEYHDWRRDEIVATWNTPEGRTLIAQWKSRFQQWRER